MEDAENRLNLEPAPIGSEGHISYMWLLHNCKISCTERERERERERQRSRCLHSVTAAACGEEEDKRLLPLCFSVSLYSFLT